MTPIPCFVSCPPRSSYMVTLLIIALKLPFNIRFPNCEEKGMCSMKYHKFSLIKSYSNNTAIFLISFRNYNWILHRYKMNRNKFIDGIANNFNDKLKNRMIILNYLNG